MKFHQQITTDQGIFIVRQEWQAFNVLSDIWTVKKYCVGKKNRLIAKISWDIEDWRVAFQDTEQRADTFYDAVQAAINNG